MSADMYLCWHDCCQWSVWISLAKMTRKLPNADNEKWLFRSQQLKRSHGEDYGESGKRLKANKNPKRKRKRCNKNATVVVWHATATVGIGALEAIFNVMRSVNPRFTYLLTCIRTIITATIVKVSDRKGVICQKSHGILFRKCVGFAYWCFRNFLCPICINLRHCKFRNFWHAVLTLTVAALSTLKNSPVFLPTL